MTNQTRRKYAHYTSYGRLMVICKKHRFICHPNFTASCRLHIVSTSEFTAIATARSQVEVSECFSHQTIDCIVTKHAARIISMMWLPCLRAYGSRILTSNGFLLPLSFIAAILSSQCQMLSLFRSNFVPQISFREASPFFYQKNKAKVNFSIIYSCFISWVFRLFESQFLQRVWNFWKIRKCIIHIKFSRSLPFTKWVIIFSQCRLN